MTEDAADLLAELRKLLADLKGESDAAYFPAPDECLNMRQASKLMSTFGRGVNNRRIAFWHKKGYRGIYLRAFKFQRRWYTCKRWLTDFVRTASLLPQDYPVPDYLPRGNVRRKHASGT